MPKANKQIFFLIGFFTLIRLLVAPFFGLGVDEAHYVLYAKYLDLSYVDHPPLVGWVHAPILYIFGTNEFLARLPAILIFAAVSYCAYLFILRITQSVRLSLISVLALNCSFMLNALALMLLPDSLLLLFIFLLVFTAEKIDREKKPIDFIFLGVLLGLMGLAKYTSILLVPPLIIFFLMKKRYDVLFSPYMFLAAFIALILITPVICWNVTHDFISFRYQGGHVFGTLASSFKNFAESLAAQFGAYSPFLFIIAFYGFFKALRSQSVYLRLAVLFGGTIMAFFLLTSFYERTLPHWPSIFYLLFIPVGTCFLFRAQEKWKKNFLYFSVGFSLVLTLFIYVELAGKYFSFPDYQSPFRDIYGYPLITKEANEIIKNDISEKPKAMAVTNWTLGSRVGYYSLPYQREVYVIDNRKDQFDLWEKKLPIGYDLLFLDSHFENMEIAKYASCKNTEIAGERDLILNGSKVDSFKFIWCRNYQGVIQ
ncbi:MAG: glycosyltransferase family 39 protein [Deltaproteobacteria bacterium]|nr:glycosyltransferase family 39 protein [Deltaproteobacteria bacterium]